MLELKYKLKIWIEIMVDTREKHERNIPASLI